MNDNAKTTMLLYADLSADEQAKLERLDKAVSSILLGASVIDRAIWASTQEYDQRVIRLSTVKGTTLLTVNSSELAVILDNTLLEKLAATFNQG